MIAIIIILIIILDQLTKFLAMNNISPKNGKNSIIRFTLIKNSGAAFGLLGNRSKLLKITNIFTLTILIIYLYITSTRQNILLNLGISCILGGGLSNLIDRIRLNCVIDFITLSFKKCPVFNIADICIFVGSIIVIYSMFF